MTYEYSRFVDGSVQLVAVFSCRADMAKFKLVYDTFMDLLPEETPKPVLPVSESE